MRYGNFERLVESPQRRAPTYNQPYFAMPKNGDAKRQQTLNFKINNAFFGFFRRAREQQESLLFSKLAFCFGAAPPSSASLVHRED